MNFKRYLEKIKKKTEKTQSKFEDETTVSENNITDQKIQPDLLLRFVGSGFQNTSFPTHQQKTRQKFEHRCLF